MNELRTVDGNEFFRQATLRISGSLDPDTALGNLLHYIKDFIPITGMSMGLYDEGLIALNVTAWACVADFKRPDHYILFPEEYRARARTYWNRKERFLVFNDAARESPWLRKAIALTWPANGSNATMKLIVEGQRIGGITLYSKEKNTFTDRHLELISMLHDPIAIAMSNALKHQEVLKLKEMLLDDNRYLHDELLYLSGDTIIGVDSGLKGVMELVGQVARLDSPVLLLGETGAGKEVIANALHRSSHRKNGPFIKVNCGGIPEALIDSELFGHEKGAFTGAIARKRGRFERAHNGTIFLDEIGELPPPAQVRLLRVLQTREIERVGGTATIPVEVRIISATHRNLEDMIRSGRFREDLWFRLNVFPIMIPPLRQRKVDIPDLVHYFIHRKSREMKIHEPPALEPYLLEQFKNHHWPGNVRELENSIERALIQSQGAMRQDPLNLTGREIPDKKNPVEDGIDQREVFPSLDHVLADHIRRALKLSGGQVHGPDGAARLLRLHPSTLRGKMRKLGIPYGRKYIQR